jgi:hypothetical protein
VVALRGGAVIYIYKIYINYTLFLQTVIYIYKIYINYILLTSGVGSQVTSPPPAREWLPPASTPSLGY